MKGRETVWVVDDDRSIRWVLEKALQRAGMEVATFAGGSGVLERLGEGLPDVVVSDIRMPDRDGLELLREIGSRFPDLPVIIMTAYSDLDSAVAAYQGGAFEYLPKPFDVDEAVELVRRAAARRKGAAAGGEAGGAGGGEILGSSASMQEVFRAIGRLSRSSITVLITGESGTGKELVARALHRHSPRVDRPFVALNTAAICWSRSSSATSAGPSPGPRPSAGGGSSRRTAGRSSSTRSATCPSSSRPASCGCCPTVSSTAWGARPRSGWTCG